MIAIHTKYLGPTNTKRARIKAYTSGPNGLSVTIDYDHSAGLGAHSRAVWALVARHKLDWDLTDMSYGDSADGLGYTFCFDSSKV